MRNKVFLLTLAILGVAWTGQAAQHDYVIENQPGAAFRADLNGVLSAIVTNNSSATAPATTYANMWWYDTSTSQLKRRNNANDAWIILGLEAADTDGTLASNSDSKVPTQKAAKTYIDARTGTPSTAGYSLQSAGAGVAPVYSQVDLSGTEVVGILPVANGGTGTSSGVVTGLQNIVQLTGSGTWTKPAGVGSVLVYAIGAGGGGGGVWTTSNSNVGGGGGGGAGGIGMGVVSVTGNVSYSVGTGGTGGNTGQDGNDGGATTFGTITCGGGGKGIMSPSGTGGAGGAGGTCNLSIAHSAMAGGQGGSTPTNTTAGTGGGGGAGGAGGGGTYAGVAGTAFDGTIFMWDMRKNPQGGTGSTSAGVYGGGGGGGAKYVQGKTGGDGVLWLFY